jgi:hypothetical protein
MKLLVTLILLKSKKDEEKTFGRTVVRSQETYAQRVTNSHRDSYGIDGIIGLL